MTVLRRGRSISQLSATARTPGADAGHTTLAVFGAPRDGFEFTDARRPSCRRRTSARRSATRRRPTASSATCT